MASGQVPWAALRNVGSYQRWCHAIAYMLHKGHTPQVPDGCCSRELVSEAHNSVATVPHRGALGGTQDPLHIGPRTHHLSPRNTELLKTAQTARLRLSSPAPDPCPGLPLRCSVQAWVIKHCLSHHPSGRPSARDVATDLRSLIAARFARARAADGATFGPESYRLHQELLSLHQHLAASAAASEHTPGDGPIAWRIADSKGQTLSDPTGTSAEAVARRSGLPPSHTVAELVEPPELGAWDPDHEFFGLPGYPLPAVDMGAAPVVPRVAQPFYKALLDVARGGSPEPCVKGILDPPAPTHGRHQSLESSISSAPAGPLSPQGMPRRARLGEVPPWERGGAPARRGNVASGDRDGSEAAQDDGASDGAGLPQTSTTARRQRDRERSAFGGALRDASAGTGGGAGSGSRGSGSRGSVLPAGGTWASGSEQWGEGSAREGPSDSVVDDWAPDRSPIPVFTSRGLSRGAGWVPAAHWRPLEPSLSEEVSPGTPFPAEAHRTGSGGALGRAEGQSGAGVGLGIESVSAPAMHRWAPAWGYVSGGTLCAV